MGQKEKNLKKLFTAREHAKLTLQELKASSFYEDAYSMYKRLGGQYLEVPCGYGKWDIPTSDFIIELDEERHFNHYRLETLSSPIYLKSKLFSADDYKNYCKEHEEDCLKAAGWGKNWMNDSTEKMFVKSGEKKDLSGNGSSRWRQRAYYDYLKDITAKIKGVPVIRISIYDNYEGKTINELLLCNDQEILRSFIKDKVKKLV